MHQDFVNGGSVQISVYPDKLYISNAGGLPQNWTVAKLMGKHRSEVRNGLVASVFYRAGFVERWGRGIEKVRAGLKEHGNPDPVYEVTERDVMVRLCAVGASQDVLGRESGGDVTQNVTQNTARKLTRTQLNILGLIKSDGSISQARIAEELGISRRTVHRNIAAMPDVVRRVGPDKGGHWKLLEAYEGGAHP